MKRIRFFAVAVLLVCISATAHAQWWEGNPEDIWSPWGVGGGVAGGLGELKGVSGGATNVAVSGLTLTSITITVDVSGNQLVYKVGGTSPGYPLDLTSYLNGSNTFTGMDVSQQGGFGSYGTANLTWTSLQSGANITATWQLDLHNNPIPMDDATAVFTFNTCPGGTTPCPQTVTQTITPPLPVITVADDYVVSQGPQLQFTVKATPMVKVNLDQIQAKFQGGNLPSGASFTSQRSCDFTVSGCDHSLIGTFTWTPSPNQKPKAYPIDVSVTESGSSPPRTTRVTVLVEVPAPPFRLLSALENSVTAPPSLQHANAYMLSLRQAGDFMEDSQIKLAIQTVKAFIGAVQLDLRGGWISPDRAALLIGQANNLIQFLSGGGSPIAITASPSSLTLQQGTGQNALNYYVTLRTNSSQPVHVAFSQSAPAGLKFTGIPSGWTANQSTAWTVSEQVTGTVMGTGTITATATIVETGESATLSVPFSVKNASPPATIALPSSTPAAIPPDGTAHQLLFTVSISGTPPTSPVTLEKQIGGVWTAVATLADDGKTLTDGDLVAGDMIYSGLVSVSANTRGILNFRATSPGSEPSPVYGLMVTSFPIGVIPPDNGPTHYTIIPNPTGKGSVIANHVMVSFVPGTTDNTISSIITPVGNIVGVLPQIRFYQVLLATIDGPSLIAALASLQSHPEVVTAEAVGVGDLTIVQPPQQGATCSSQWGLADINESAALTTWNSLVSGTAAHPTVAVIDSGIDATHTDLSGNVTGQATYNYFVTGSLPTDEPPGHGTMVSGVICANGGTAMTYGVAPGFPVLAIKVCGDHGDGNGVICPADLLAAGILGAADSNAAIINLSIELAGPDSGVQNAVSYAAAKGKLVVAAAGNDGLKDTPVYPAGYAGALPVAALTQNSSGADVLWLPGTGQGTNYGAWVPLAAPGDQIASTSHAANYYSCQSGTSFAAPHVSGTAALLWMIKPTWNAGQVRAQLTGSAQPFTGVSSGRLDAANALTYTAPQKALATVTLGNLTRTYTGSPLQPTVTISQANLAITWTNAPQTNAGSYFVTATVNDTNYQGSASGTFVINKAPTTVTAWPTASSITYGQALSASTLTGGAASVPGTFAFTTPATTPGANTSYSASVTFTPTNANYNTVTGTVKVTVNKATATVNLNGLCQVYTGKPLTPTATTSPTGLAVTWTGAPQTRVGSYNVKATVNNANYQGSASGTFVIKAIGSSCGGT